MKKLIVFMVLAAALLVPTVALATPTCSSGYKYIDRENTSWDGGNTDSDLTATIQPKSIGNVTGSNCSTTNFCHALQYITVVGPILPGGGFEWIQVGFAKESWSATPWARFRYIERVKFVGTDINDPLQTTPDYNNTDHWLATEDDIFTTASYGNFELVRNGNTNQWTGKYAAFGTPTTFGGSQGDSITFGLAPNDAQIVGETYQQVSGKCIMNNAYFYNSNQFLNDSFTHQIWQADPFWQPLRSDYPYTEDTPLTDAHSFEIYTDGYPH